MTMFFTADTHFGDPHILRHRGRLFGSIEDHDAALIAQWNEVVGPDDTVWHLGDFAGSVSRARCAEVFEHLHGIKRLVRGNHDTDRVLCLPWVEAVDSARLTVRDEAGAAWRLFLAHYPHRSWPGVWRGVRHLYGHTHGTLADSRRSCDVGADAWAYRPVALADLIARQDEAERMPEELAAEEGPPRLVRP